MLDRLKTQGFQAGIERILKSKDQAYPHLVTGLDGSARAIYLAELYHASPGQMVVVESNPAHLNQFYEDLCVLLPEAKVLLFPAEESLAIESSTASYEGNAQRVEVLQALTTGEEVIVVTSVAGIQKRLTPLKDWQDSQTLVKLGDEWEREDLLGQLERLGYRHRPIVEGPGDYSVRGAIIDFYPLNSPNPIRLDFFDTEVDSIRYFDVESQRSLDNISEVCLEPVLDVIFPLDKQQALNTQIKQALKKSLAKVKDESLKANMKAGIEDQVSSLELAEPLSFPKAFMELYDPQGTSLLDYLAADSWIIVNEFAKVQVTEAQIQVNDQFWIEQETGKGRILPGVSIKLSAFDQLIAVKRRTLFFSHVQSGLKQVKLATIDNYPYRSMNQFFSQMSLIKAEIEQWIYQDQTIQIAVETAERANQVERLFKEHQIHPTLVQKGQEIINGAVNILVANLSQGFEIPSLSWVFLTEKELFNKIKKNRVRQQKLSNAEKIKSYSELSVDDYVVHVHHGIGRYTGMETMEIGGIHRDLMAIEYQNNGRILIPVDQIHLIQKYIASAEGKTPKLHKLGGSEWAKTKQKVAGRVEDIADELIKLYAAREQEQGYAFSPDTPEQTEFENAFPYVETPDQLQSSKEIKKDMERSRPMDRLLIGDVGYGKTEVAMRAIFKAVMDGKQVAFLVPTTILAQQHYNTLVERFSGFPFEIRMLSRFVTKADQNATIKDLKIGACQIVVGTHRLLSKDIEFLDLGLLVVDEEQRFGVKHKERLKQLREMVDVLTLTATPIPRTLHMSMIGVRDLSVIETPPSNRYPVQTYVMERDEGAIKAAIERELGRGGQCFYLYNRVANIYQQAEKLSLLVPDARVAVAHGQMTEIELENVLLSFIAGEYDVLVTTTIIETGVDIPNANTLFIDHADKMGLSTLYQLRGRVGRTNRMAFAYLMYDPMKQLSEIAEKRLYAIREFTELGSGFKIAMRDLSIRGAGNLLGSQQSGFIDSVGYDLYSKMLEEAIDQRKGKIQANNQWLQRDIELELAIDAYIPTEYIQEERQKITAYQAIQKIDSQESYQDVQDQLIDRYGNMPDEVADLIDISYIRYLASQMGVTKLKKQHQYVVIHFNEKASQFLYGPRIFEALEKVESQVKVTQVKQQIQVQMTIQGFASYQILSRLKIFLTSIQKIVEDYKEKEKDLEGALMEQK